MIFSRDFGANYIANGINFRKIIYEAKALIELVINSLSLKTGINNFGLLFQSKFKTGLAVHPAD
jgi:hypothetical protein